MIAVVLPTWLSLCWDRLTHAILLRGFLPEVFRKRKASENDRCHSFFLLVYNFYSSKSLLRIRFCHNLAHPLILEKPLKTYLTRTERRQESNRSGSHHHVYDSVKPSRQWDQKFTRSLKPVRSPQNAVPEVQNQWNPKGNRGISLAVQRVSLSAPAAGGFVSFQRLGNETAPTSLLGQKQDKKEYIESVAKSLWRPL